MILRADNSAHWYFKDGKPSHESTLREARKLGLLPSVTSILSVWPKSVLETYKIEQAIMATLAFPRGEAETLENYVKRAYNESKREVEEAAIFGRRIHKACEQVNLNEGEIGKVDDDIYPQVFEYSVWYKRNVIKVYSAETTAINLIHGYAGQYDLVAEIKEHGICVVDLKTQKFKWNKNKVPVLACNWYDTWGMQLSAYRASINNSLKDFVQGRISVAINSTKIPENKTELLQSYVWPKEEDAADFEKFLCCSNLWRAARNYYYNPKT